MIVGEMMDESLFLVFGKPVAVFGLIAANGFFVAAEFSRAGVRRSRVEEVVAEGQARAGDLRRYAVGRHDFFPRARLDRRAGPWTPWPSGASPRRGVQHHWPVGRTPAGAGQPRRPGVGPDLRQGHPHRPVGPREEVGYSPCQTRYGAKTLGDATRAHWGIENRAHCVRDVTQGEDASRIRTRPGMMARIHSVALDVLRANGVQNVGLALQANAVSFDQPLAPGTV